ncbi:Fibronectin type III domain protein [compost metagenome]
MYSPQQLVINSEGTLYVADLGNDRISMFELDGTYIGSFGSFGDGDGQMDYQYEIHVDTQDNLYVVNRFSSIQKFNKNGVFLNRIATDIAEPTSIAFDSNGNTYVASGSYDEDHGIVKYDAAGNRLMKFGSVGEEDGQMYEIYGMAVNPAGQLLVNDPYNYRLQIFTSDGVFMQKYGRGYGDTGEYLTFDEPENITQTSNGDIHIPNGWSPYVQVLSYVGAVTPPSSTVPSAPQNITVNTTTPHRVTVTWSSPVTDGGTAITNYQLEYKKLTDAGWTSITVAAPATTYTISSLDATEYQIRLTATNSIGVSVVTTPLTATVTTTPPAPTTNNGTPAQTSPSPSLSSPNNSNSIQRAPVALQTSKNTTPQHEDSQAGASTQSQPVTAVQDSSSGRVLISWQPPVSGSPSGYIIEYRDSFIPDNDTTTPWKKAYLATADQHSATITLPAGEFTVRVAALTPGDTTSRVILGVATVKVTKATAESDGQNFTLVTTEGTNNLRNWILACIALLAAAALYIILVVWKRRRNKARATSMQLPPQRWS